MKKYLLAIAITAAAALSGSLVGCHQEEPLEPDVLARINGEEIRTRDLQRAWSLLPAQERNDYSGPEGIVKLLDELVTWKLMAQEAEKRGLDQDPLVENQLKVFREQLLVNTLLDSAVSDAEVYRYFQEHFLRGRLIYLVFPPNASAAEKEKVRKKIAELHDSLKNGADFAELAAQNSEADFTGDEGDLGYVTHETVQSLAGFTAAESLFALKETGQFTEPVEGKNGYIIFELLEPPRNLNPAGMDDSLRNAIRDERRKEVIRSFDNELNSRPDNKIERNQEAVREIVQKLKEVMDQAAQAQNPPPAGGTTVEAGGSAAPPVTPPMEAPPAPAPLPAAPAAETPPAGIPPAEVPPAPPPSEGSTAENP